MRASSYPRANAPSIVAFRNRREPYRYVECSRPVDGDGRSIGLVGPDGTLRLISIIGPMDSDQPDGSGGSVFNIVQHVSGPNGPEG